MFEHQPVLAEEVVSHLTQGLISNLPKEISLVDCTLGGAGHAILLAETLLKRPERPLVKLFGFDQDPNARIAAELKLKTFAEKNESFDYLIIPKNFDCILEELNRIEIRTVDVLLADLGVSSHQLDAKERGFSVRFESPVDMRMDPSNPIDASNLLLNASVEELEKIFREYGEEPRARHLARAIEADRKNPENIKIPLNNAAVLSSYFNRILGYKNSRSNPSIRIFQAIRIAVNDELGSLNRLLNTLPKIMSTSGRSGLISFHSLEDRIVKHKFRQWEDQEVTESNGLKNQSPTLGCEFPRGGVTGTEIEVAENVRARSARLRVFCWGENRKIARKRMKE